MSKVQTITINSGSLFALAAKYYNDATMWWLIASVNGLSDPQITTPMVLKIPEADRSYHGGISRVL